MTELPVPPDDALAELIPADVPDDPTALRHAAELDVWYGHVWSRLARGDLAWAWWDGVDAVVLDPWVAAERGRVLRELGLHGAAEEHDEVGLAGAVDPVDIVMLRLGLTADAIGLGDLEAAELRLAAASSLLDTLADSPWVARQRLRRSWVALELAIASGGELPLDGLPDRDPRGGTRFPSDYAAGTRFHRAKGLLFAGIGREDPELLDAAAELAPPVLLWAVELARADRGHPGAMRRARAAWDDVVPPPGHEAAAGRTATGRRLTREPQDDAAPDDRGRSRIPPG